MLITRKTRAVLNALLADPEKALHGWEITERTGLLPGTLYPILGRLETVGWVRRYWGERDPDDEKRPRHRYTQLTGPGVPAAQKAVSTPGRIERILCRLGRRPGLRPSPA